MKCILMQEIGDRRNRLAKMVEQELKEINKRKEGTDKMLKTRKER